MWFVLAAVASPQLDPQRELQLMDVLESALADGEALGRAASMSLNAVPFQMGTTCDPVIDAQVAAARAFGEQWSGALDDIRPLAADLAAAQRMPTLTPLRSQARAARQTKLLDRAARTQVAQSGFQQTLARRTDAYAERCQPVLSPVAGRALPGARASDDPVPRGAILVVQPGYLCSASATAPVEAGPYLFDAETTLCFSKEPSCSCETSTLLQATVL